MAKIHVLHISIYPEKGKLYSRKWGVASYLKNLLVSGSNESVEISVLADIDEKKVFYTEDGMTIYRHRSLWIKSMWDIISFLVKKRQSIDVVHMQHEPYLFGSTLVAYIFLFLPIFFRNQKWIITSHHAVDREDIDSEFVKNHGKRMPVYFVKFGFKVLYWLYRFRDIVIVHEDIHKKRLHTQYGILADRIHIIPHGVEDKKPLDQQEAKEYLGVSAYSKVLFYMWYVTWYKDLRIMIEWYAQWMKGHPNTLLIIGAWPEKRSKDDAAYMDYYRSLQDLAKELIPEDRYQRLWFIASEDISYYYSACDAIILPYRYTLSASGPMALAIAYEKPFLASACFAEYFPDFTDCIFAMNASSFAEVTDYFYLNQELYKTFIKKLKSERKYALCMQKIIHTYVIQ